MTFNIRLGIRENFSLMRLLSAKSKLQAVLEVVNESKSLKETSLKYGCCRQSLYLWVKKFQSDPKRGLSLLKNRFRVGLKHPKRTSWRLERIILDLVIKYPLYSIYSLKVELVGQGHGISAAGVYQVLLRHELQTKELRRRFSLAHPARTVFASSLSASLRAKLIDEYLKEGKKISDLCRIWQVSRQTFYFWLKRYQVSGVQDALAKRYKRGVFSHKSIVSPQTRERVLELVRTNPALSCHKLYAQLPKVAGVPIISHQALQNLLTREGLSLYSARVDYSKKFARQVQTVAPLYVPQMPLYRLRMLLSPFVTVPKLLVTSPRQGLALLVASLLPLSLFAIFVRAVLEAASHASIIGLFIASVALFFGLFFFIYSLSYYVSIFMVLKLAQGGTGSSQQTGGVSA